MCSGEKVSPSQCECMAWDEELIPKQNVSFAETSTSVKDMLARWSKTKEKKKVEIIKKKVEIIKIVFSVPNFTFSSCQISLEKKVRERNSWKVLKESEEVMRELRSFEVLSLKHIDAGSLKQHQAYNLKSGLSTRGAETRAVICFSLCIYLQLGWMLVWRYLFLILGRFINLA